MEGKVGVVASGVEAVGTARQRLWPRRYVATFGTASQLGALAYAAASRMGGEEAAEQVVVADGAAWIKAQVHEHFPRALAILDWAHVARAAHRAIRAARPGVRHRALRREVHQTVGELLWTGHSAAAVAALADLRRTDERCAVLEQTLTYLETQRDWLGDYGAWQAAGYPIGSGAVEREVDVVINRRLTGRGMRWKRANADAVLALRVDALNDEWIERYAPRGLAA